MRSQKRLADRKARCLELGRLDRANRCQNCLRPLGLVVFQTLPDPRQFCSPLCQEMADEHERMGK